ncbi:MAG: TIGR02646 family protein [Lachnospiraceae bacterium]|nr:TIGR02646 family protein [Lachnospiraceae bacterium]
MIVINRGKEPDRLLEFRMQNPEADYEDMPPEVRDDVREQMWREQRHLCGYCMKRIKKYEDVRIEHCRPRHPQGETEHDKSATLDFKWMLGVCYGNSLERGVNKEDMTCDAHRGNADLAVNPYSEASIKKIKYRSDGRIYSDDPEINRDVTETLNLNCEAVSLPQTRRKVLEKEKSRIFKKCRGKSQVAVVRELERTYVSLVQERNLTPYCGIIISWLEDRLKKS